MFLISAFTQLFRRLLGSHFLVLSFSKHTEFLVKHKVYKDAHSSAYWTQFKRFKAFQYVYLLCIAIREIIGGLVLKQGMLPSTYRKFDPMFGSLVMKVPIIDADLLLVIWTIPVLIIVSDYLVYFAIDPNLYLFYTNLFIANKELFYAQYPNYASSEPIRAVGPLRYASNYLKNHKEAWNDAEKLAFQGIPLHFLPHLSAKVRICALLLNLILEPIVWLVNFLCKSTQDGSSLSII